MPGEEWPEGPVILGTAWDASEHLIRTAAGLAAALGEHLICAFVDPASRRAVVRQRAITKRRHLSANSTA